MATLSTAHVDSWLPTAAARSAASGASAKARASALAPLTTLPVVPAEPTQGTDRGVKDLPGPRRAHECRFRVAVGGDLVHLGLPARPGQGGDPGVSVGAAAGMAHGGSAQGQGMLLTRRAPPLGPIPSCDQVLSNRGDLGDLDVCSLFLAREAHPNLAPTGERRFHAAATGELVHLGWPSHPGPHDCPGPPTGAATERATRASRAPDRGLACARAAPPLGPTPSCDQVPSSRGDTGNLDVCSLFLVVEGELQHTDSASTVVVNKPLPSTAASPGKSMMQPPMTRAHSSGVLARAGSSALLFAAHWFGARRFDHGLDEDLVLPEHVRSDTSTPAASMHAAIRDNFRCRSGTWTSLPNADVVPSLPFDPSASSLADRAHSAAALPQGAPPPVSPAARPGHQGAGSAWSRCRPGRTAGAGGARGGVLKALAGGGTGGGGLSAANLMCARVSGPENLEGLVWQHLPIFVALEGVAVLGLWFLFAFQVGGPGPLFSRQAGLDSLFPMQSDVFLHRDCQDHRHEIWRWLTYQFTHGNFQHVFMNTLLTFMVGIPLEGFHGSLRVSIIFNVGVAGGALSHLALNAHSKSLVGMSGGCYAFMGMHLADLLINWSQSKYRYLKLGVLIFLACMDVVTIELQPAENKYEGVTSHAAHVGGYAVGLFFGVLLGRNIKVKRFERSLQLGTVVVMVCLVAFCITKAMEWPPRSFLEAAPWCWVRQVYNPAMFGDKTWHCVRCHEAACIQKWSQERNILPVNHMRCPKWVGDNA